MNHDAHSNYVVVGDPIRYSDPCRILDPEVAAR